MRVRVRVRVLRLGLGLGFILNPNQVEASREAYGPLAPQLVTPQRDLLQPRCVGAEQSAQLDAAADPDVIAVQHEDLEG